ncbi:MAG: ATP-dependent helicase, partial [Christensenellales bacterium]
MIDLDVLNPQQRQAVLTTEGPLLVLAGAGSGKTRAVTYRIAALLDRGVSPYEILALTFTNKAANEMKERVVDLAGMAGERVWMSTFHSFCARLLRMDIERLGYTRDFVIYDDADQMAVIADVQQKMNFREEEWPKKMLRAVFSDAKNKSLTPAEYILHHADSFRAPKLSEAMTVYTKIMAANNALDFDDLLLKTLELFRTFPEVLDKYATRFRYIHVDEYQDTNLAQYTLVKMLSSAHNNICVVGDDDQSIYGWRGADIRNILDFERDFPGCTVIRLEQNYRSTSTILDAAN